MSYKNLKEDRKGFTIIEVLIVLAIAGLILLIVFLAVPALQRNAHNTATKEDVGNVLGGIAEFQGANNGKMPQDISGTGTVTYKLTTGGTPTTISVQGPTKVSTVVAAPASVPLGEIQMVIGQKCPVGGAAAVSSARSAAAYFSIETTSTSVLQCQDS
jgi:prepilin-type N-terminal cleavage/methylation domain-containing protein